MATKQIRPMIAIGQGSDIEREFTLERPLGDNWAQTEPVDLTDADTVTISLEHVDRGFHAVHDEPCTITVGDEGKVEYRFGPPATLGMAGDYYLQFEVTYNNGDVETIPPSGHQWWIHLGFRQATDPTPLSVPRLEADVAALGDAQLDAATVYELTGGIVGDTSVTDLAGANLYVDAGRLNAFDPAGTGEVFDHLHTDAAGEGGPIGTATEPAAPANFSEASVHSAPVDDVDAVRQAELDAHDHSGDALGVDDPLQSIRLSEASIEESVTGGGPVHNVKYYGAEGDGSTNDTQAVQDALNAAGSTSPGGTAFFPEGDYLVSSTVTVPNTDGLSFAGPGRLRADHGGLIVAKEGTTSVENLSIEGITIDGNNLGGTGFNAVGLTRGCELRNLSVVGCSNGIEIGGSWSFAMRSVNISGDNTGTGLYFGVDAGSHSNGASSVNVPNLSSVTVRSHAIGLHYRNGNGGTIRGSTFELNGQNVTLQTWNGGDFTGNYVESSDDSEPEIILGDDTNGICRAVAIKNNRVNKGAGAAPLVDIRGLIGSEYRGNYHTHNGTGDILERGSSSRVFDNDLRVDGHRVTADLFSIDDDAYTRTLRAESDTNGYGQIDHGAFEVSTTAEPIAATARTVFVVVHGEDTSDSTTNFIDLVLAAGHSGFVVVDSRERRTPASRSYSVSGESLELAMGSGTYYIQTQAFGGARPGG